MDSLTAAADDDELMMGWNGWGEQQIEDYYDSLGYNDELKLMERSCTSGIGKKKKNELDLLSKSFIM